MSGVALEQYERFGDGVLVFRLLYEDSEIARREIGWYPTDEDARALRIAQGFMRHHDQILGLEMPEEQKRAAAETEFSLACEHLFGEQVRPWMPQ